VNDEFEVLFKKTTDLIYRSELKQEMINSIVFVPVVLFIFFLIEIPYTFLNVTFVIILSFLYGYLKELMFHRRTKKMLSNQYQYLISKYGTVEYFIPVLDKRGRRILLKPSSIVIKDNTLFLEAYKQAMNAGVPSESIRVNYGEEFFIEEISNQENESFTTYYGKLAGTNYRFLTVKDELVRSTLEKYYKQERN